MNYDEEKRSLAKWFVMLEALLLVVFTAFDLLNIFSLAADGLKLACIVLCFLFSITLIFSMEADLDRLALMLSFFFAVVADTLLLFTDQFFFGVLAFCVVQEFQSIRIFSVRRSVVRMDGRIFSSYRSYKVRNKVLFLNLIQLLFAAVPVAVSFFVEVPHVRLISVCVFYLVGFIGNLIPLASLSRDVRLLDDMRPLKAYFAGMLLYFMCDVLLGLFRMPEFLPVLPQLSRFVSYAMLVIWPLYLAGMVCICLSGIRKQKFYS